MRQRRIWSQIVCMAALLLALNVLTPMLASAATALTVKYDPFGVPTVTGEVYTTNANGVTFHVYNSQNAELKGYTFTPTVTAAGAANAVRFTARGVYNNLGPNDPITVKVADADGTGLVSQAVYGAGSIAAAVYDAGTNAAVTGVSWLLFPAGSMSQSTLDDPSQLPGLYQTYHPLRFESGLAIPLGNYDIVANSNGYFPKLAVSSAQVTPGQTINAGTVQMVSKNVIPPTVIATVYDANGGALPSWQYAAGTAGGNPYGALTVRLNGSQNMSGVASDTFKLKVNTGDLTPQFVLGNGDIQGWQWDSNTRMMTISVKPASFMDQAGNGNTIILLGIKYYDPLVDDPAGQGSYFATNGYSWSHPTMDANHNLRITVTGNHNVPSPFFNTFFPAAQAAEWGITDPSQFGYDFSNDGGNNNGVTASVYQDVSGITLKMNIHFSSDMFMLGNKVKIAEAIQSSGGTQDTDSHNGDTTSPGGDITSPGDGKTPSDGNKTPSGGGTGLALNESGTSASLKDDAGKVTIETGADGIALTKLAVDTDKLQQAFKSAAGGDEHKVTIDLTSSNVTKVSLPASVLADQAKALPDAVVSVKTSAASYDLPLKLLDLAKLSAALGTDAAHLNVNVTIHKVEGEQAKRIALQLNTAGVKPLTDAIDFQLTIEAGDKRQTIDSFGHTYVSRSVTIPAAVEPGGATAVMIDPVTGSMQFVPAVFTVVDGKTLVTMKRNGNSIYSVVQYGKSFIDLKDHWAKPDIELLASKMLIQGETDSAFGADHSITRAQFAALVTRALGLKLEEQSASGFKDVISADGYAGYIGAAVKANIIAGYEDGTFRPSEAITREQMAVMLSRALEFADSTVKAGQATVDLNRFADSSAISGWAKGGVAAAYQAGLIQGMTDRIYAPQAPATRAEAAVMLERMLQYLHFIN